MIIIFEGLNGVGKTTYATAVAEATGHPIFKAFRETPTDSDSWIVDKEQMLALGVPVNRYPEDIYVSDFLRLIPTNVVLDRSFPSAIIYGDGDLPYPAATWDYLFDLWNANMKKAGAVIVWLECDYSTAKARCQGRGRKCALNSAQYKTSTTTARNLFTKIGLRKIKINTVETKFDDGLRRVLARVKEWSS